MILVVEILSPLTLTSTFVNNKFPKKATNLSI